MASLPHFNLTPADRAAILAHVKTLTKDEEMYERLAKEAAELANLLIKEFSAEQVVANVIAELAAIYDEIVAGSMEDEAEPTTAQGEIYLDTFEASPTLFKDPVVQAILQDWSKR